MTTKEFLVKGTIHNPGCCYTTGWMLIGAKNEKYAALAWIDKHWNRLYKTCQGTSSLWDYSMKIKKAPKKIIARDKYA